MGLVDLLWEGVNAWGSGCALGGVVGRCLCFAMRCGQGGAKRGV